MSIYGDSEWRINISNIRYNGYINKWDVKYQIDGQNSWNTSEDLSFVVNEKGIYNIYIANGDVKSDEVKKALGVAELTPDEANETELSNMLYGVIEIEFLEETSYKITKTPNEPILKEDMKAVYWGNAEGEIEKDNSQNTTEIDSTNSVYKEQNWYNYESQSTDTENGGTSRWANAIVAVDKVDSYFVWIPRYAYRIIYFSYQTYEEQYRAGEITEQEALDNNWIVGYSDARGIVNAQGLRPTEVSSQTAISVNNKYFKTHPVFDGDVNYGGWAEDDGTPVKLQGIWVAKYEASSVEGNSNNEDGDNVTTKHVRIQPGVPSWRNITIGNMFTNAKKYNQTLNSHLMKNSEWGAVAYLTESKYGRNGTEVTINTNSNYYTGGGNQTAYISNTNQNTTGNVYGIYDLSGGAYEYVASYYNGSTRLTNGSAFATHNGTSDSYSTAYNEINVSTNYKYGDATYETMGWYMDESMSLEDSPGYSFFHRGGYYSNTFIHGIFDFRSFTGESFSFISFRVCLVV